MDVECLAKTMDDCMVKGFQDSCNVTFIWKEKKRKETFPYDLYSIFLVEYSAWVIWVFSFPFPFWSLRDVITITKIPLNICSTGKKKKKTYCNNMHIWNSIFNLSDQIAFGSYCYINLTVSEQLIIIVSQGNSILLWILRS